MVSFWNLASLKLPFWVISQRSKIAMHCKSFISICFRDLSLACYLSVRRPWHTALRPSFIINTLQEYKHSKGLCFLINIHMLVCIVFPPQLFLFLSLSTLLSLIFSVTLFTSLNLGWKLFISWCWSLENLSRRIFPIMTSYEGLKCSTFSIRSDMSSPSMLESRLHQHLSFKQTSHYLVNWVKSLTV